MNASFQAVCSVPLSWFCDYVPQLVFQKEPGLAGSWRLSRTSDGPYVPWDTGSQDLSIVTWLITFFFFCWQSVK